jgi:hypothetical protein
MYSYAPLDYRATFFDTGLVEERRLNAGGFHALLLIGYHW